jgi:hypothetical protein
VLVSVFLNFLSISMFPHRNRKVWSVYSSPVSHFCSSCWRHSTLNKQN